MHALDNVIWQALTTRQSQFAEAFDQARRFVSAVTSLTAFEEPSAQGYASLAGLVGPGGTAALFLEHPYEARSGWERIAGAPLLQMVCENGSSRDRRLESARERVAQVIDADRIQPPQIVELGLPDSPEMLALTTLTKPGPFGTRTHELGTYLGIRENGKLVAMAGERLKVPGYTEVSAVCTHPDYTGKGYAGVLMTEVMRRIGERGETPLLHVRRDNRRAAELYERLGFRIRVLAHFAVLRKV